MLMWMVMAEVMTHRLTLGWPVPIAIEMEAKGILMTTIQTVSLSTYVMLFESHESDPDYQNDLNSTSKFFAPL